MPGSGSGSSSTFWDGLKSFGSIAIWVVGIVFAAGSIYNRVNEMDETTKNQDKSISVMKDNQVRMLESFDRMEKYTKESSEKMMKELSKVNEKMSAMEERIIKNEMKIERVERDIEDLKEKKG